MNEVRGWLLDLYAGEEQGLVLWIITESGERKRFLHDFPITFYAAGPPDLLRQAWRFLQNDPIQKTLSGSEQLDLFSGPQKVLAVSVTNPAEQPRCFHDLWRRFPALIYYNTDIPLTVRYAAALDLFPLARCRLIADEADHVQAIEALDSPWDLNPQLPPLRILRIEPNVDPQHDSPRFVTIHGARGPMRIPIEPWRGLMLTIRANINRYDPDLILTRWGDTWLFPRLMVFCKQQGITYFNPNRDSHKRPLQRKENSYFTYGQIVYRGSQFHLYGRWHIDQQNAVMVGDYGLPGVLEQARVTGLPVQEVARKSPGAGVTAMQMQMALRRGILVPHTKQQAEEFKTLSELIHADRGGLVYQPLIGLHRHVAEIDFISMYPSLMVHYNVSPETVGQGGDLDSIIPELDRPIDQSREGVVPATLRPLIAKRLALKQQMADMDPRDCRYQPLKARAAGLKWLLVVCFGYLGYKNARFGRIEAHEAVTACSRDVLLTSKETAEEAGYQVLHMYVDALWVKRQSSQAADKPVTEAEVRQLLDTIAERTGLPIALEGIYRWVAFLPSCLDDRIPVPNRYFGIFADGTIKTRGIELNRGDTPPFIAAAQREALQILAALPEDRPPADALPEIISHLRGVIAALRGGQLSPETLLITHRVSRLPDEFRAASPAARALRQLAVHGYERRPGQRVQFIYTRGNPGVYAWDLPEVFNPAAVDIARYSDLLIRAAHTILQLFGIEKEKLRTLLLSRTIQLQLPLTRTS
ncbi:MAG: DNA polymerase domain-containing protein [Candidatus Promineifilaceae bacterium]|jgi:DNA polymerase-2